MVSGFKNVPKTTRIAVVADLHYGLAPDAGARFDAFLSDLETNPVDAVMQMGDFCHPGPESEELCRKWRALRTPRIDVLGNHDMDKGTKRQIMDQWAMRDRFYAMDVGHLRFVVLDLNNLERDGRILPYEHGNYFASGISHNWADPEQLDWLRSELLTGSKPTVLVSHQPIGFGQPGEELPTSQTEILDIVVQARSRNPAGAVVLCLSGHLHVDRLETVHGIPCLSVNSASYFWHAGMHPYRNPLYAFLDFDPSGVLSVQGRSSAFVNPPPASGVAGMRAAISHRRLSLKRSL